MKKPLSLDVVQNTQNFSPTEVQEDGASPWGEAKPLTREMEPAQVFPLDCLPSMAAAAAKRVIEVVQAPPAIAGQCFMSVCNLAAQGLADVEIDGRVSPLSENFVTVAESSERKTAIDKYALKAHNDYQTELSIKHEILKDSYQIEKAAYDKCKDQVLNTKKQSVAQKKAAVEALGPPPVSPLSPILTSEEPTLEGLVKHYETGRASQGLFSNEGGRFVGGNAMSDEHQLKTAAGLSEFWDGKDITRIRAGDGASCLRGRRLAVHLMLQPGVSDRLFGNDALRDQGLLSRCLSSRPESTAGDRPYRSIDLSSDRAVCAYVSSIGHIIRLPLPLAKGRLNELEPRRIRPDEDAKKLFISLYNNIEKNMGPDRAFSVIRGFAGKAPEHSLRLAATIQIIEDPAAAEIGLEAMEKAAQLVNHYLAEALRIFGCGALDKPLVEAQELLKWLRKRNKPVISTVEIYRYGPQKIRDAKRANHALSILMEHGWVRTVPGSIQFEGITRKDVWGVRLHD